MAFILDKDYTFNNYTVNNTNSEALQYAMVVSNVPGLYSPLYISGEEGTGKSHLLQAIGNSTNAKVAYYSILNSKEDIESIKDVYNDIEVLLLDDFEYLIIYIQKDILLKIFEDYNKNNKQLVISSIYTPDELKLDSSIIKNGTIIKILKPDEQIKTDALKHRIQELKIRNNLTHEAIDIIVDKYLNNLLDIDNILYRIQTCIELFDPYEVDKEFVDKCL